MFRKSHLLSMKGTVISCVCGIMMLVMQTAVAQGPGYISVGDFSGTANQRIAAAIAAAMATDHKTVYFPNGTYALRSTVVLNRGTNTKLHLIGESRDGVFLIPDIPYLEANYNGGDWENGGARLAHMIDLSSASVFASVDVSIQNMTVDMRHQRVMGEPVTTYNVVGHGIRVGKGWVTGQFTVNQVTIRNTQGYGIGIQDRDGHPKNNITLTDLLIERAGSDGIDTKEASGDGNRNLVIRNVSINEVGFLDTGAAPGIDLRYRSVTIENVNIVSKSNQGINPGQSTSGINFRPWDNGPGTGIVGATVSNAYIRGTGIGIALSSDDTAPTPHQNVAIRDFKIQGQQGAGVSITGTNHSGHTISNGFVDPAFGGTAVVANGRAVVTNVVAARWDPALTPLTKTTFESNVSLAGKTYSPAWVGMVGSEEVSINPTAPGAGPFVFDVRNTGVMQIDYDTLYNEMDKLIVKGTLILDGQLRINLIGGAPTAPGTYQIFDADSITGSFDSLTLPTVPGMTWVTNNLATDGTISLQLNPGSITPVNIGSRVVLGPLGNASASFAFDAGAAADLLIVALSSEKGAGAYTVTYGGVALTPSVLGGSADIWHLDLTTNSYAGGAANLVVNYAGVTTVNGVGIGAVSVTSGGQPLQLHATAIGATGSNGVSLATSISNTFNVVSFNANGSGAVSVNSPLTPIYANGDIGSARGAAGFQTGVPAGVQEYSWTTGEPRKVVAAAFVVNTFSSWIAGFNVGVKTGLGDDPDGDGQKNGVEQFFGTAPNVFSKGLTSVAAGGNTFTFTHPQGTLASDLSAAYCWSKDLVTFTADGATDSGGTRVDFTTQTNAPSAGITTVTATITGTPTARLFVVVQITRNE